MIPVATLLDVDSSVGAVGYSYLEKSYDGRSYRRMTFLFIRDSHGSPISTILAPAETLKELIHGHLR
jgi:hypothetical protein